MLQIFKHSITAFAISSMFSLCSSLPGPVTPGCFERLQNGPWSERALFTWGGLFLQNFFCYCIPQTRLGLPCPMLRKLHKRTNASCTIVLEGCSEGPLSTMNAKFCFSWPVLAFLKYLSKQG